MTHLPQQFPSPEDDPRELSRVPDRSSLRVSDSEREAAANTLRDHCAQGRLSPDELSERLDLVYASRTSGALDTVFDDLPTPPASAAHPRVFRRPGRLVAAPVLAAIVALSATSDPNLLWLAWPALALAGGHRHPGRKWLVTRG